MTPMRRTPLSQLASVSAGQGAPKDNEFSEDGVPFVRAGSLEALIAGKSESELELVSPETAKLRKLKTYPKGTILFAKSGMSATKDRIYVLQSPAHVVSHLATLVPKDGVHADCLRLALKRFPPSSLIKDPAYPAIGIGEIEDFEIYIPEKFDDQVRIAHVLGKVEGLIAQRRKHLQQLDDLLKSAFVDMFGDVRTKKSTHPWVALRPYLKANSGKSSKGIVSEIDTGIPIYGGNGVNGWAKEALYQEPVVIAGRVGQQCGVIHLSKEPCWVTDNAIVLSISDQSKLNAIYLARAFQYAPIRERVKQLDLPFINQSMLLDYPLPLPPIDIQNKFSAIVGRVDGIKSRYQQSLANLESLYAALSQLAFKGELEMSRVPMPGVQPENKRIAATEPEHDPVADSLSIHLPEIGALRDQVQGPIRQQDILRFWLEAFCHRLGDTSFSVQQFMGHAIARLTELHPNNDFELSASDYEQIKAWVFEALSTGRLTQLINVTHYDEDNDKPVFGNMIELKASQP